MRNRCCLNRRCGVWGVISVLLLVSLACGTGGSDDSGQTLEQTRQALQGTQLAIQALAQTVQATALPSEPPPPPTPVVPTKPPQQPTQSTKPTQQKPNLPQPAAGVATFDLTVVNRSADRTICYLYAAPSSSDSWGDDLLGGQKTIPPGASVTVKKPGGVYDISVDDCNGNNLAEEYNIKLTKALTWTYWGAAAGAKAVCGDQVCSAGETAAACPADCGGGGSGFCGDGVCGTYENTCNCPEDCGSACGDGMCADTCGEDATTC
ncbi:MAG: hypothetical protein HPY45_17800, partial [Anaerolineae bacterium]|nr:hypothetical protein [Anaerolineae bacterium]